jgi:hypothetical protein
VGDAYIHYPAAFLTKVCVLPGVYGVYRIHQESMTLGSPSRAMHLLALLGEYEEVFSTNRMFVERQFGDSVAAKMKLTDSQDYLELALHHMTFSGTHDYNGYPRGKLIKLLPDARKQAFWRMMGRLPRPIYQWAIGLRKCFFETIRRTEAILRELRSQ